MANDKQPEGWGWPRSGRKAHYFVGMESLCRQYMFFKGDMEPDNGPSPDDCAPCRRALEKRQANANN